MEAHFPDMQRVLDTEINFSFPLWLVAPQELKTSARVRLVYDAIGDHLTAQARREKATNTA